MIKLIQDNRMQIIIVAALILGSLYYYCNHHQKNEVENQFCHNGKCM